MLDPEDTRRYARLRARVVAVTLFDFAMLALLCLMLVSFVVGAFRGRSTTFGFALFAFVALALAYQLGTIVLRWWRQGSTRPR